jgi:translation initiation factor 2 beta subunit (eIF-2beta)/eIF-5
MSDPYVILNQNQPTNERGNMSRAITVKVATPKVIKALENRLAQLEKDYTSQEANEAKFEKSREKWRKEVQEFAIANVKKATNFRTSYRHYNNTLNIDYDIVIANEKDLPVEPERDFEIIHQHSYREMKEDITNALTILKMTDEETVNASTMKQIARYL